MDINARIKIVRGALQLTLREFCTPININNSTLSLIENGKRNATDRTIADICRTYLVNEEWLRTGTGDMFVDSSSHELNKLLDAVGATLEDRQLFLTYFSMSEEEKSAIRKWFRLTGK